MTAAAAFIFIALGVFLGLGLAQLGSGLRCRNRHKEFQILMAYQVPSDKKFALKLVPVDSENNRTNLPEDASVSWELIPMNEVSPGELIVEPDDFLRVVIEADNPGALGAVAVRVTIPKEGDEPLVLTGQFHFEVTPGNVAGLAFEVSEPF